jgi:hypothetical protein
MYRSRYQIQQWRFIPFFDGSNKFSLYDLHLTSARSSILRLHFLGCTFFSEISFINSYDDILSPYHSFRVAVNHVSCWISEVKVMVGVGYPVILLTLFLFFWFVQLCTMCNTLFNRCWHPEKNEYLELGMLQSAFTCVEKTFFTLVVGTWNAGTTLHICI